MDNPSSTKGEQSLSLFTGRRKINRTYATGQLIDGVYYNLATTDAYVPPKRSTSAHSEWMRKYTVRKPFGVRATRPVRIGPALEHIY